MFKDTNISSELHLLVVAIRKNAGEMTFNPSATTQIMDGDLLIVVGQVDSMQKLIGSK